MTKRIDIDYTGQTIGYWEVLQYEGIQTVYGKNQHVWLCRCVCGTTKSIPACNLRSGKSLSCGCKRHELSHATKLERYGKSLGCLNPPKEDLSGTVFGYWTVLEYAGDSRWLCQCVCGVQRTVVSTNLRKGISKSCGCKQQELQGSKLIKDELGKTYGRLTVIERADIRGGEQYWLCECECGNTTVVRGSHLRSGETQSCMCLFHEMTLERITTHGLSKTRAYQSAMCKIRSEAEKLIETQWTPEMELFLRRLFPYCVVCGISEREHLEMYGQRLHVDHVNPLVQGNPLGPGNAVVLCKHCNCTKWSHSLDELPYEMALPIQVAADTFNVLWKGQ